MTHPRPASLARRAFPALAVLGASGALLSQLGGTKHAGATLATTAGPVNAAPPAAAPSPTTGVPARPGPGGGRTPQGEGGAPTPPNGAAPGGAAPTTTVPAAPACSGTTVAGSTVQTRFGPVEVAAVVGSGKTLCDVQVLAYPDGDRRSLSINQWALPVLRTQAIQSNGKNVVGVSGATITTNAYRTSLQAALDKAR